MVVRPVKRLAAFTLIELLVVIGIIALLVSILLPVLGRVQESAASVKCLSNIKQIGLGMIMYAGENKDQLPCVPVNKSIVYDYGPNAGQTVTLTYGAAGDFFSSVYYAGYGFWFDMRKYGVNAGIARCPSDNDAQWGSNWSSQNWAFAAAQRTACEADPQMVSSYYYPFWARVGNTTTQRAYKLSQTKPPTEKILMIESTSRSTNNASNGDDFPFMQTTHKPTRSALVSKPNGWGNAVFADGHAEYFLISRVKGQQNNVVLYHTLDGLDTWNPMQADLNP